MNAWLMGWGKKLGYKSDREYLASIPEIPKEFLKRPDSRFPLLVLVDGRLGLKDMDEILGVHSKFSEEQTEHVRPETVQTGVRWMVCQTGSRYYDVWGGDRWVRKTDDPFAPYDADEIGLDVVEGLATYVQYPRIVLATKFFYLAGVKAISSSDHWSEKHITPLTLFVENDSDFYCNCPVLLWSTTDSNCFTPATRKVT